PSVSCHLERPLIAPAATPMAAQAYSRRQLLANARHRSLACRRVAVRPHAVFVIFRRRKEDARLLLTAGNLAPRARSPWAVVAATENWIVSRKLLAREVCGP